MRAGLVAARARRPWTTRAPRASFEVGLAVADVAAADGALPEAAHQLLAGDVAPALVDVALVGALVDDDRLAPRSRHSSVFSAVR